MKQASKRFAGILSMCGRAYSTYTDEELEARYLTERLKRNPLKGLKPNFNLAPTQTAPIVRVNHGKRVIELARWQFVPVWSDEFKTKLSTINATAEKVFESRMYKGAVTQRRCIVPFSGFIEWRASAGKLPKRPFKIHLKDEPIMSLAGIWEAWRPGTDEEQHSFAIITTGANAFMKQLHHRMPVVLAPKDEAQWLDPELQEPKAIAKLLKPCPASWLAAEEISTAINSPRNNRAEILQPAGEILD